MLPEVVRDTSTYGCGYTGPVKDDAAGAGSELKLDRAKVKDGIGIVQARVKLVKDIGEFERLLQRLDSHEENTNEGRCVFCWLTQVARK